MTETRPRRNVGMSWDGDIGNKTTALS